LTDRQSLIVGITGATGTILGVRILQLLREAAVDTHLVMSHWGARTLIHETPFTVEQVQQMATHVHPINDLGAEISSGSLVTLGMVIAVACGVAQNLIHRAADVVLKERRKLVLVAREAPLNDIHLENMLRLSRAGAVVYPPVPSFYNHPESLEDMVNYICVRVLDQFGLHLAGVKRWDGTLVTQEPQRS
jgi:4-hydroxy-3-polyprenylbenzoate decarboxylase